MARGLGKDVVAIGAVVGAAVFGTWLYLRSELDLGTGWTDGEVRYDAVQGERIRYAVWDAPERIDSDVNGDEAESRPALSPDGRWLVFAVGERGLNADLYVAEVVSGEPRDARPIGHVNTSFDELAPAFGPDALYFASDRSGAAFGLDLWRAPFADGVFGMPEAIGPGLNTAADETDPVPVPGTRDLVFASNRERGRRTDYDLFRATLAAIETTESGAASLDEASTEAPAKADDAAHDVDATADDAQATERWEVARLDALNTPFDEREPALTSDGRTLVFASDRAGGLGSFDLYRSMREDGEWLRAEPLVGVNSWRSERGPFVSADGFSLFFDLGEPGVASRAPDLWRARSKELFRLPAPALSLAEILILVLLLVLAILAWLSKRWRTIDVIYKCFLISLLLHLAMMWYLREVYPESEPVVVAGQEQLFHVRLAQNAAGVPSEARERSGELAMTARVVEASESAPSRAESGQELAAAAPAAASVEAPRRELQAPERRDAALESERRTERPSEVARRMQDQDAPFEKKSERARELTTEAAESLERAREVATTTPAHDATSEAALARALASTASAAESLEVAASRSTDEIAGDAPRRAAATRTLDPTIGERTEVAVPVETFVAARAAAPSLSLPDAARSNAPSERVGEADRLPSDAAATSALALRNDPTPARASVAQPARTLPAEGMIERERATAEERVTGTPGAVAMRAVPESRPDRSSAPSSAAFDATAAGARTTEREAPAGTSSPDRFDVSPATAALADAVPTQRAVEGLRPVRDPEQTSLDSADRSTLAPTSVASTDASVAVRAIDEELTGANRRAEPARRFDPTEGLTEHRAERAQREDARANRRVVDTGEARLAEAAPAGFDALADTPRRAPADADATARGTLEPRSRRLDAPVAMRSIEDARAERREAVEPRRFDATSGLAAVEPKRARRDEAELPRARRFERPETTRGDAPSLAPDVLAAPAPALATDDLPDQRPSRLEHTPYKNRFGEQKLRALEEFGGGVETERAVAAGLAYLASIQRENGAWGDRNDFDDKYRDVRIGKTALAMLAFLGAGHTPDSDTEFSGRVRRAIAFLVEQQSEANGHFGNSSAYGHGIATYALAECYALTKLDELRAPLERGIARVLESQNRNTDPRYFGGWGYYFRDDAVWNGDRWPRVSVTSWQVMALESARLGGLSVPDRAFDDAQAFLLNAWDGQRGAFRYAHDPSRLRGSYPILPASTPAAIFALSLVGVDVSRPELEDARRFVLERAPSDFRYTGSDAFVYEGRGNLYFWYYATLAMFRVGGDPWERWNASMKDTLLGAQEENGSWEPISVYARDYAGDDDRDRSYATAMCVLTLEVYYRYFTPLLTAR